MGFLAPSGILNRRGFFGAVAQAKAFVPTDISGCKLWVSADYGITKGTSFINEIEISGCDPDTSDGLYTRSGGGNETFYDGGNSIFYEDGAWKLYDESQDIITFINYNSALDEGDWVTNSGVSFGSATNNTQYDSDAIAEVLDRSPAGNLLTNSINTYISNNIINGMPAFNFDGGRLTSNDIDTAKTLYAVIKTKANIPTPYAAIIETTGGGLYSNVSPNWGSYFGGSFSVDNELNTNSVYILGSISDDGNNYEFRQNGSTAKTDSDGQGFLTRSTLYFGNDGSGTQPANCYIAEAIVYDIAITTSEAQQLESYLNEKYAIY